MLSVTSDVVRLFLHVLAAAVWVGGQITLAGLVPGLRQLSDDAPRAVARRFNRIAWPAFAVLVVTGIWNIVEVDRTDSEYLVTLGVKIALVVASGASAALHLTARNRAMLALWGAIGGLSALLALFVGVLLHVGR